MRTLMLAMTDVEHDKRSWRCLGTVCGFMLLTVALRVNSREQAVLVKQAVSPDDDFTPLVFTAVTALGQLLFAAILLKMESSRGDLPNREALSIIFCSHFGAMFLQSYLSSLGPMQGSLASAFTEPLMALATLWMVTSLPGRLFAWLGLALFSFGVTFLTFNVKAVTQSDRTSLIQGLAGLTLVLRNIVTRHLISNENVAVTTRGSSVVTGLVVIGGCVMAALYALTSPLWLGPAFCSMTSMLLSAFLAYVTTCVLKRHSVTFLSVFHVAALLAESLLLTPMAQRPTWLSALCALVTACAGLYLFLKDWEEGETGGTGLVICPKKPVNTHEQYTRVEFLLFSSMVIGVIFYVFQPRVSQRDLHTLSYVGLDKVIRRLLSVDEPH